MSQEWNVIEADWDDFRAAKIIGNCEFQLVTLDFDICNIDVLYYSCKCFYQLPTFKLNENGSLSTRIHDAHLP